MFELSHLQNLQSSLKAETTSTLRIYRILNMRFSVRPAHRLYNIMLIITYLKGARHYHLQTSYIMVIITGHKEHIRIKYIYLMRKPRSRLRIHSVHITNHLFHNTIDIIHHSSINCPIRLVRALHAPSSLTSPIHPSLSTSFSNIP